MRFAFSDEQIEFSEAVRSLLERTCTPDDVRSAWPDAELAGGGSADGNGRVSAAWSALAEMGVLGIMAPEALGGLEMDDEGLSPLLIEAGRVSLPDPLASTAGVVVGTLAASQGDEVDELLRQICAGAASVGVLFSMSDDLVASSDMVASASTLDALLVYSDDSVSLIRGSDMHVVPVSSVDGARDLGRVTASGGTVLANGSDAAALAAQAFDRAGLYSASELLGLSERMVEMAVAYATERHQFGVPIGSFQAVKHHLADAAMAVEFVRPLVMRAAHSVASGDPEALQHVSMAKARAAQAADSAARASLQVHGGIGYTVEYDLHLFMKRSWALAREFGDAAFHTRRVRRSLGLR